jgi:hypothetical protein
MDQFKEFIFYFFLRIRLSGLSELTYEMNPFRHLIGLLRWGVGPLYGLYLHRAAQRTKREQNFHTWTDILIHDPCTAEGASTLLVLVLRECGRFHEPEQRDQPEPCARAVRYSVGRAAVCTYRQVTPRDCSTSTQGRVVWTYV